MKKYYIFILIFIVFNFLAYPQDSMKSDSLKDLSDLKIYIELANPQIYHQNDEIYINIKIINISKKEKVILISKEKRYSFDFELATMQNKKINHNDEYIISFHRVQPIFNSHITIAPDEGYIFEARLNDYFDMNISGQFYLKCLYFPELKVNQYADVFIESNQLSLNIRPGNATESMTEEKEEIEQEKRLFVTKRSPDEVVSYMLNARMNKEWEKYFLYLNMEQLILTNNNFKQRYLKADVERQKEIIREYKEYLKQDKVNDISFLPIKYDILKTEYTQGRGKVDVLIYVKYEDLIEKKYYTYFLNKKDNIWYISSYEVLNFSGISQ